MVQGFLALVLVAGWMTVAECVVPVPLPGPLRCQYPNGTFLASARVCADSLTQATCQAIFTASSVAGRRPPLCDNFEMADLALQCARTCAICCETAQYGCMDSLCKL